MRPILWGTIWFVIGMIGWIIFSVIGGSVKGITGESSSVMVTLVYVFGTIFFFSLPIAIIAEIIRWKRKKTKKKETIIYRDLGKKKKEEGKEKILEILKEKEKITNNDVEKLLGVSDATATNYLQELENEGKVEQVGKTGRSVFYRLK